MRSFIMQDADGISPWYKQVNAGKKVLPLNLKSVAGQATLEQLLGGADILLESYRPGVMDRLGFGRGRLQQLNPALIHCALSGFGQTGPYRLRAGHDLTYMAASGMLELIGNASAPVIPFPPISDYAGGKQAATAILAALLRRERTGQGAYLDVSLFESVLSWQGFSITAGLRGEQAFARGQDLLTGGAACYQIYRTADQRFVALGAIEEKFWTAFCLRVDHPEWIARQHEQLPQQNLIKALQQFFAQQSLSYWQELLQNTDCCFEAVSLPQEVANHPQVNQRELLSPPAEQAALTVGFPVRCDESTPRKRPDYIDITASEALSCWLKD
jgi:crotonobetainyl-CoA:carnitine CoA-transferase CaiB-like acyl-CoA transferase